MTRVIGITIIMVSVAGISFAGTIAPEIDGSSAIAAVGLLAGGLLVLGSRKKRS